MSEIEKVQEWMKADMEAMKEQMATMMEAMKEKMPTMMEAMMSMKKVMEVNVAAVAATNVFVEVDPTPPSGFNQMNYPTSDMVGQGGNELGSTDDPHFV